MSLGSKWAAGCGSIRILRVSPKGWKPTLFEVVPVSARIFKSTQIL
jgi:hypothetical protein